jgi:hypothetical protein
LAAQRGMDGARLSGCDRQLMWTWDGGDKL